MASRMGLRKDERAVSEIVGALLLVVVVSSAVFGFGLFMSQQAELTQAQKAAETAKSLEKLDVMGLRPFDTDDDGDWDGFELDMLSLHLKPSKTGLLRINDQVVRQATLPEVDTTMVGGKVGASDADVGDTLAGPLSLRFVDAANAGILDPGELVYVDADNDDAVSPGDVRITEVGGFPSGSRVWFGDDDVVTPPTALTDLPATRQFCFPDLAADGYGAADAVYLIAGTSCGILTATENVQSGDLRLSKASAGPGYAIGSYVDTGDADITTCEDGPDPPETNCMSGTGVPNTFRFRDLDGDGFLDADDELYLTVSGATLVVANQIRISPPADVVDFIAGETLEFPARASVSLRIVASDLFPATAIPTFSPLPVEVSTELGNRFEKLFAPPVAAAWLEPTPGVASYTFVGTASEATTPGAYLVQWQWHVVEAVDPAIAVCAVSDPPEYAGHRAQLASYDPLNNYCVRLVVTDSNGMKATTDIAFS